MKTLIYTIACGGATKELQKLLQPSEVLVLDEYLLKVKVKDRIKVRMARARIREFIDIDQYDGIICIEPDVEIPKNLFLHSGDYIEIENGNCLLSEISVGLPPKPAPWNGYVAVPRRYYSFFDSWLFNYQWFFLHGVDELVLHNSLNGFPFVFRNVQHHKGLNKMNIMPDFFDKQKQDFS